MKSSFKILPQKGLIIETLSADITTDEYVKLKHDEFHDDKFNRHFNLISDFSLCDTHFDHVELQNMITIFKENKGKIYRTKSALILSDIGLSNKIDVKTNKTELKHKVSFFTDFEDAESWILS